MNRQFRTLRFDSRPQGLLAQIVAVIVGVLVLGVAIVVGGILLSVILGLGLIAAVLLYCRVWWLRRKGGSHQQAKDQVIETDYIVVSTSQADDDTDSPDR